MRRSGLSAPSGGQLLGRLLVVLLLALAVPLLAPSSSGAAVLGDDYPHYLKQYARDAKVDPWLFYNRECTSFVAWRLNNAGGVPFNDYYLGKNWGNASNWRNAAQETGVPYDGTPTVGSVAWWAAGSAGSHEGHVAWVASVSSTAIVVEEYNYLHYGAYDTRTIYRGTSIWPGAFIHLTAPALGNTAPPTVAGAAQVGATLLASPGKWSPTGASYRYQWLAGGVAVKGATARTFRPAPAQLSKHIQVKVTATKKGVRPGVKTSAATAVVAPGVFTTSTAPQVSGTPQVGQPLTASAGTWSPAAAYTYQWLVNGTAVPGATRTTYNPTPAQLGQAIAVRVTARATGYRTTAITSASTSGVIPGNFANTAPPTVSGVAKVGQALTAAPGTWSPAGTYSYQWTSDGQPIAGATRTTFTPTADQLGTSIAVSVAAAATGYNNLSETSAGTSPVLPGTLRNTALPTVTGTAKVGVPLTATKGRWVPAAQASYQWMMAGAPIDGATGSTFTPGPAQAGQPVSVQVTASRPGYDDLVVSSVPTGPVQLGTLREQRAPTITGVPHSGQPLDASTGTWSVAPDTADYQWLANGKPVTGATSPQFVPGVAQAGERLTVRVTVHSAGYAPATALSQPTQPIIVGAAGFTSPPRLSGSALVGQVLRVSPGRFTPPGGRATYQWLRGSTPIHGATGTSYTVRGADLGSRLSVSVSVSGPGWTPTTRSTLPTAVVRSVPTLKVRWRPNGTGSVALVLRVHAPGEWAVPGRVQVYWDHKVLRRLALTSGVARGSVRVPHGIRYLHLVLPGSRTLTGTSLWVRVRVS